MNISESPEAIDKSKAEAREAMKRLGDPVESIAVPLLPKSKIILDAIRSQVMTAGGQQSDVDSLLGACLMLGLKDCYDTLAKDGIMPPIKLS